jgi:hypothetical protein
MTQQWHDGTTLDDQLVASWWRLKPERQQNGKLATALSWLRRYPTAWLRVVSQDTDAASIAVQRRWTVGQIPRPTEQEIAHVEFAARRAIAAIHERHIPEQVVVPFRAAAQPVHSEVKRGPIIDHDPDA